MSLRTVAGFVMLVTAPTWAVADCKSEIIQILDSARKHGPSEERTTRVTRITKGKGKTKTVSAGNGNVIRIVPPDRSHITVLRDGRVRLEAISIGKTEWEREPGKPWKQAELNEPLISGPIAHSFLEQNKAMIEGPACHGATTLDGQKVRAYSFGMPMLGSVQNYRFWSDEPGIKPVRVVIVSILKVDGEVIETTSTTDYLFDPGLSVEPPTK